LFEYQGLKISWLGHDGFKIKNAKTVYIDPFEIETDEKADILLITHEHFDHCRPSDIETVVSAKTTIITTPAVKRQLSRTEAKEIRTAKPGEKILIDNISIETVQSYNVNKFRSPGKVFHPKESEMLGFIVTMNGVRVYHAGDSDLIPQMEQLNVDIAFLPVSGIYVMTPEEAAEATKRIKPKIAIPMHYGSITEDDGSFLGKPQDAERFKKLAACEVRILARD
jgi:L-ascorbate metabolism protein UlaG (beta-lactamase superfamily)